MKPLGPAEEIVATFAKIARPIMRQWMPASSCIGSARTTIEVMRLFRLNAVEIPVCFAFQVPTRKYVRISGFSKRERAEMKATSQSWRDVRTEGGGWNGHLIVLVENRWILDPSIDQADAPQFAVSVPAEVFVADTLGQQWDATENFEVRMGMVLDNGDHADLIYRRIRDTRYLATEAWSDEGLPFLAGNIASKIEARFRLQ